jgi:small GTP-binding protein/PAS domain S-box-containing protein
MGNSLERDLSENLSELFSEYYKKQSSIGIIIVEDLKKAPKITYYNNKLIEIFEISKDLTKNFNFQTFFDMIHTEDKEIFTDNFLKAPIFNEFTYRITIKPNLVKWINQSTKIIKTKEKIYNIITLLDITEQKETENDLKTKLDKFAALIENSQDLIWSVDNNYIITTINSTAKSVLFVVHKKAFNIGENFLDLLPIDIRGIWQARYDESLEGAQFIISELFSHDTGDTYYEISFNPTAKKNITHGVSVVARDVTEQKRLLNKLKESNVSKAIQLNDTVIHLQEEITERKKIEQSLRDAINQAERANRAKSEFLANMSHELRTPLNSIIGFSDVLMEGYTGEMNEEQEDIIKMIKDSGNHLLNLINEILDLSKIESGKIELHKEEFSIKQLITKSCEILKDQASKKEITLDYSFDLQEELIYADEIRIKQVLFNLISNSLKFTPEKGSIGIKSKDLDKFVEITVWDTGIGIAENDIKKLFTPFKQIENPYSKKYAGTGLGLHLCKEIVNLHNGDIHVRSILNKGSEFIFTLPKKEYIQNTILFLGINYSGKTSIINSIINNNKETRYQPTIETIVKKKHIEGKEWKLIDVPGSNIYRIHWTDYLVQADIIIFVLDMTNYSQFSEAKREYTRILSDPDMKKKKIIFLFHKIDTVKGNLNYSDAENTFKDINNKHSVICLKTSIEVPESIEKLKKNLQ